MRRNIYHNQYYHPKPLLIDCVPTLNFYFYITYFMIGNDWDLALKEEFEKDYFLKVKDFVDGEYESKTIYPPYDDIFNATCSTSAR